VLVLWAGAAHAEGPYTVVTSEDETLAVTGVTSSDIQGPYDAIRLVCTVDCRVAVLTTPLLEVGGVTGTHPASVPIFLPEDTPFEVRPGAGRVIVVGHGASGTLNILTLSK
jgi:hypothetical protein